MAIKIVKASFFARESTLTLETADGYSCWFGYRAGDAWRELVLELEIPLWSMDGSRRCRAGTAAEALEVAGQIEGVLNQGCRDEPCRVVVDAEALARLADGRAQARFERRAEWLWWKGLDIEPASGAGEELGWIGRLVEGVWWRWMVAAVCVLWAVALCVQTAAQMVMVNRYVLGAAQAIEVARLVDEQVLAQVGRAEFGVEAVGPGVLHAVVMGHEVATALLWLGLVGGGATVLAVGITLRWGRMRAKMGARFGGFRQGQWGWMWRSLLLALLPLLSGMFAAGVLTVWCERVEARVALVVDRLADAGGLAGEQPGADVRATGAPRGLRVGAAYLVKPATAEATRWQAWSVLWGAAGAGAVTGAAVGLAVIARWQRWRNALVRAYRWRRYGDFSGSAV